MPEFVRLLRDGEKFRGAPSGAVSANHSHALLFQWIINGPVYLKSTIIAFSTVVVAFLAGTITHTEFQRKTVLRES